MILRTIKNLTYSLNANQLRSVSYSFCNKHDNNKNNGFQRFKKLQNSKPTQKKQKKQNQNSDDFKIQAQKDIESQQKKISNQEQQSQPTQQVKNKTGFAKFVKKAPRKKPFVQKKLNTQIQEKQSPQSLSENLLKNKGQPSQKKSIKSQENEHAKAETKKQEMPVVNEPRMAAKGFQKFKKNPKIKQFINIKKNEQINANHQKLNTEAEQQRKKRQKQLQQGQKFFRDQLRKIKQSRKHKQNEQKQKNAIQQGKYEFRKTIQQMVNKMRSKQEKKPQQKIPDWVNDNSTMLSIYLLLKSMRPWGLLLFGFGLIWIYSMLKKIEKVQQVENDFLIDKIKGGNIQQTWIQKITRRNQQQIDQKHENYIYVKCQDGKTYRCISNEDFQSLWKNIVSNYNIEATTMGLKKPINVKPSIQSSPVNYLDTFRSFLSIFLMVMVLRSLFKTAKQVGKGKAGGGNALDIFGDKKSKRFRQVVNVKFNDVMGMQKSKEQIVQFIDFLKNPEKYNRLGAKIPRGALLTGPPGTGKTMIAKACAGQSNVPFFCISGSQFIEMYVGVGAQRVRDLFQQAKQSAPSIIFIDEIDAVGKKRSSGLGGGNDQRDTTLNQLLVEMDGFDTKTNVIVFAATNQKQVLDPALIRPGRFDRLIQVDLPDLQGRKQIFMVHLKPLVLNQKYQIEDYAKRMATLTPGFSGADIKNLCNEAAIIAARGEKSQVSLIDFELATERIIGGVQKKSTLITPQTRKTVAYHECGHGVVSWFLQGASPLLKLTIIPRSKGALGFAQYLPNQNQISTKQQLQDQICVILGGRICQQIFFGKVSTGAYDDLQKAYHYTKQIIAKHGMSQSLGWLTFNETEYAKEYSQSTQQKIDKQILSIIKKCSVKTRQLLQDKKDSIDKLAQCLLEKETIDQNIIEESLGPRPFKASQQYQDYLKEKRRIIDVQAS